MDLHHRLMRQTINIAVSKALEDMRSNPKRSLRNLIDLGLLFSRSENQKYFFGAARKVIDNPRNPYNDLASRTIADVDVETIKTVGMNLGYSSLNYGARKLQQRQETLDCPLPWLMIFDVSESSPDSFQQMETLIREGREMGIYSYIFCPHDPNDIAVLCEIAKRFGECLFVFQVSALLIQEQTARSLGEIHNAVVSVSSADTSLTDESCVKAFHILRNNRCFYGFHTNYNESTAAKAACVEYIRRAISYGNRFGVYIAEESASASCRDAVYDFVCSVRGGNGLPLATLEWSRDLESISRRLGMQKGYRMIRSGAQAYDRPKKEESGTVRSLAEIIRMMTPYTNAENNI